MRLLLNDGPPLGAVDGLLLLDGGLSLSAVNELRLGAVDGLLVLNYGTSLGANGFLVTQL
jgi:hypothetical protein